MMKNHYNIQKKKKRTSNAVCIIRNNIKTNLKQKTKNGLNMYLGPKKHPILILVKLPKRIIFGGLGLLSCEGQSERKAFRTARTASSWA